MWWQAVDGRVVDAVPCRRSTDGRVAKVEGLALLGHAAGAVRLLAVVDDDDPESPSMELVLRVDGL